MIRSRVHKPHLLKLSPTASNNTGPILSSPACQELQTSRPFHLQCSLHGTLHPDPASLTHVTLLSVISAFLVNQSETLLPEFPTPLHCCISLKALTTN